MMKIFKFPIEITDTQVLRLPEESEILCVQLQDERPHVWVFGDFNLTNNFTDVTLYLYGTGHTVDKPCTYLGTFQKHGVWHLFY